MALGGSKRVPRKNAKMLGTRELIGWTIEAAKNAKSLDFCLVSTNDREIRDIARKYGGRVPFKRTKELAEDCDTTLVAIDAVERYEAKKQKRVGHVCILQPTSPFRTSDDIDRCVQIAVTTGVDTVISVTKAHQSPYWMFQMKAFSHELESFMNIDLEGDNLVSQNLPTLFYPNGAVYVVRRDVLMSGRIFGERVFGYMMPRERSVDIEEEFDFLVCSALMPQFLGKEPYQKISWVIP